jgi:hypothetical protein
MARTRNHQAAHPCLASDGTDGLLAPRNSGDSGGIAAPEGRRCKVSGARRIGAQIPPSRRNGVAHLNYHWIRV